MQQSDLTVADVMRPEFVTVDGMTTVNDALQVMREGRSDILLVNKRSQSDEYGVLLLADIVAEVLAPDRAPDRVNVYEIMSKPAITVSAGMSVKNCARLFKNVGISSAPVMRDDEIVGIVSYRELAFGSSQPG